MLPNRTSPLWKLFKRTTPGLAKCCICKKNLSYKSSISNLKRHLVIKHPGGYEDILGVCSYVTIERRKETSVTCLIALVKMHPCLWDTRCESYGNVEQQHDAWNTIASRLCPKEEQSEAVTRLSEQFNGLRNGFFSKRQCSYYEQLSFMEPLIDRNDGNNSLDKETNNIEIKNEVLNEHTFNEIDLITEEEQCSTKKIDNNNLLTNKEGPSKKNVQQVSEEEHKSQINLEVPAADQIKCSLQLNSADDDTLFLLSLVDEMKMVPKVFQMNFKADLLSAFSDLVKSYQNEN